MTRAWLLVVVSGCRLHFDSLATGDDGAGDDARGDVRDALDPRTPWGPPVDTGLVNDDVCANSTITEVFYVNVATDAQIMYVTRTSAQAPWSLEQSLPFNVPNQFDGRPRLTPDDRTMYFASDRMGPDQDIFVVSRPGVGGPWGAASPVPEVNTALIDKWFSPCAGGHYVMVREGVDERLFEGTLGTGPPAEITSLGVAGSPFLSPDCLTLIFKSDATGGGDLYITTRTMVGGAWSTPTALDEVNDPNLLDEDPWMSPDGRTLLFARKQPVSGAYKIMQATR